MLYKTTARTAAEVSRYHSERGVRVCGISTANRLNRLMVHNIVSPPRSSWGVKQKKQEHCYRFTIVVGTPLSLISRKNTRAIGSPLPWLKHRPAERVIRTSPNLDRDRLPSASHRTYVRVVCTQLFPGDLSTPRCESSVTALSACSLALVFLPSTRAIDRPLHAYNQLPLGHVTNQNSRLGRIQSRRT